MTYPNDDNSGPFAGSERTMTMDVEEAKELLLRLSPIRLSMITEWDREKTRPIIDLLNTQAQRIEDLEEVRFKENALAIKIQEMVDEVHTAKAENLQLREFAYLTYKYTSGEKPGLHFNELEREAYELMKELGICGTAQALHPDDPAREKESE
jgi:hypothetical protein